MSTTEPIDDPDSGLPTPDTENQSDVHSDTPLDVLAQLSLLCSAIGDSSGNSVRARALWALHVYGPQSVSKLSIILNVAHATLSAHLKTLESANLVTSERVAGVNKVKTLNRETIHNLIANLNELFFKGEQ